MRFLGYNAGITISDRMRNEDILKKKMFMKIQTYQHAKRMPHERLIRQVLPSFINRTVDGLPVEQKQDGFNNLVSEWEFISSLM